MMIDLIHEKHIYQPQKMNCWGAGRRKSPEGSDYCFWSPWCCGEVIFKLPKNPKGKPSRWNKGQTPSNHWCRLDPECSGVG